MTRFSKWVIQHAKVIILITTLLTLGFGYFLKDITINPDMTSYLPDSDPVVELFNHVGDQYGGNALGIVAIETDNVFSHQTLTTVQQLTSAFQTIPGVKFVTSLTNVIDMQDVDGQLEIGKLIDEYNIPSDPNELEQLKSYTLSKDKLRGRLVSEDAKLTVIVCHINKDKEIVSQKMKTIVEEAKLKEKTYFSGLPFQMNEINDFIIKDLFFLVPLILLVIFAVLFISFRTIRGVLLPLLSVSITSIWTLGLMSLLNISLTVISNVIPVIIIAVGSAYSIHVISKFYEKDPDQRVQPDIAATLLEQVSMPVLLTGITTIAGFLSFVFGSYLIMIREFGLFTAIGVCFTLINAITFVPAMIVAFRVPRSKHASKQLQTGATIRRFMDNLARQIFNHKAAIVISACLVATAFIFGIPKIERKVDFLDYFKKGTAIRQAEAITKKYFGGSVVLQIVVDGDMQNPDVLNQMQKMKAKLETIPEIHNPLSIADYIEDMSDIMDEGKSIPDSRSKVANLWFLLEGEDVMAQLVNDDYDQGIIQATQKSVFTRANSEIVAKINQSIKELTTDYCTFRLTGSPAIYKNLDQNLLDSQIQSLSLALLFISICLMILLKSFKNGLIGMVPIVLSLIIVFGFMGYASIPLDVATVLVASVSIGIGVDYAIHFVSRLRFERKRSASLRQALEQALETTGRAIFVNVITVTSGFLVLLAGNLVPLQRFGMLIALTMISAGLGALTVVPSLLLFGKKENN